MISFTNADYEGVRTPHDDTLVISSQIANCIMKRMMVDTGSSVYILSLSAFKELQIDLQRLRLSESNVMGFTGSSVGIISLSMTLGEEPHKATKMVDFLVVNTNMAYNDILGRSSITDF